MAVKVLLCTGSLSTGSTVWGLLQDGGTVTDGGVNAKFAMAKTAGNNYAKGNFTATASVFGATAQPVAITTNDSSAWRTGSTLTGTFAAGNWTVKIGVVAGGGANPMSGSGIPTIRIWQSANADGSSATEITSGIVSSFSPTPSNVTSTTVPTYTTATIALGSVTLSGQYLFLQFGWKVVTASGSNNAQCEFWGSSTSAAGITTTDFSTATTYNASGTVAPSFSLAGDPTLISSLVQHKSLPDRFLRPIWNPPRGAVFQPARAPQTQVIDTGSSDAIFSLAGSPTLISGATPYVCTELPERVVRPRWNPPKGAVFSPARFPQSLPITLGSSDAVFSLTGALTKSPKSISAGASAASFSISGTLIKTVGGSGDADRGWQGFGGGIQVQHQARTAAAFVGASQTIAVVNGQASNFNASATTAALAALSLTAGNCIVVGISSDQAVSSVTDTAGNTYVLIRDAAGTGTTNWLHNSLWYAKNVTGHATNVVTAHFASAGVSVMGSVQLSGADKVSPADTAVADANAAGVNSVTSSSFTPSVTGGCAVAFGAVSGTQHNFTAGTNYTLQSTGAIASGIETRLNAPRSAQTAVITIDGVTDGMNIVVALIKPAMSAGTSATGGLTRRWWPSTTAYTASRPTAASTLSASGNAAVAFTLSGSLTQTHVVAGATAAVFGLAGAPSKPPKAFQAGSAAGSFTLAGDLIHVRSESGLVAASFLLAGGLTQTHVLSGGVAGTFTLAGTPTNAKTFPGATLAFSFTLAGQPRQTHVVSGTAAASFTLAGTLNKLRRASGTVAAVFSLSGLPVAGPTPASVLVFLALPTRVTVNEPFMIVATLMNTLSEVIQGQDFLPVVSPSNLIRWGKAFTSDLPGYGSINLGEELTLLLPGSTRTVRIEGVAFQVGTYSVRFALRDSKNRLYFPVAPSTLTVLGF